MSIAEFGPKPVERRPVETDWSARGGGAPLQATAITPSAAAMLNGSRRRPEIPERLRIRRPQSSTTGPRITKRPGVCPIGPTCAHGRRSVCRRGLLESAFSNRFTNGALRMSVCDCSSASTIGVTWTEPTQEGQIESVRRTVKAPMPDAGQSDRLDSTSELIGACARGTGRRSIVWCAARRAAAPLGQRAAARWARDLADTDDLVQDTLLRTFNKMEGFEPRDVGALQAYLRQAVINRLRDELRRKGRAPAHRRPRRGAARRPRARRSRRRSDGRRSERYEAALARLRPEEREAIIATRRDGVLATRRWRRCSASPRRMRRARRRSGRCCAWPRR